MASSSATVASRYPEITLSACEGYTETLVDWVNTGQLDFALINVPRRKTPLAAHHVMDEEMVFACRKEVSDQAAGEAAFRPHREFRSSVLPSKRHGLRLILDEHAAAARHRPAAAARARHSASALRRDCDHRFRDRVADHRSAAIACKWDHLGSPPRRTADRALDRLGASSAARWCPSRRKPCSTSSATIWHKPAAVARGVRGARLRRHKFAIPQGTPKAAEDDAS